MNPLAPCPACRRHVRVNESSCPFCHAALSASIAQGVIPAATQRLKRAATFAFTASLTLAGCGPTSGTDAGTDAVTVTDTGNRTDSTTSTDTPATTDTGSPTDTGTDVADNGNIVAAYGGPTFPDAGMVDSGGPLDDGGPVALYGAPAFPDSGVTTTDAAQTDDVPEDVHDAGGVHALYGAPAYDGGGGGLRYGAPPVWDV